MKDDEKEIVMWLKKNKTKSLKLLVQQSLLLLKFN